MRRALEDALEAELVAMLPADEQAAREYALAHDGVLPVTGDDGPAGAAKIGELQVVLATMQWRCVCDRWRYAIVPPIRATARAGRDLVRKLARCETREEALRVR